MQTTVARRWAWCATAGLLLALAPAPALAQSQPRRTLVIGTKAAPPFAIKSPDGTWSGISIDLWEGIAADLGYRFELEETDLDGLLAGVRSGAYDAGVAALTVTPEREAAMDFTQPFHISGLGIATRSRERRRWLAVAEQFFSLAFLKVVASLVALLFLVGGVVWLFERRQNAEHFGGGAARGLGASFWWSAVTMTTVGYGDKAPRTVGGRVVALLWMFAALVVISSFTASITASLTVGSLEGAIAGPEDLPGQRIASVPASTSAAYLEREGLPFTAVATPAEGLDALARGDVDVVVYDAPILRYEVRQHFSNVLTVLPVTFERQLYAIALPAGSPLREPIDQALLRRTLSPDWPTLVNGYLGQPGRH